LSPLTQVLTIFFDVGNRQYANFAVGGIVCRTVTVAPSEICCA